MDTIEMNDFDQPEGAEGGDTPVDEDDFWGGLNDNDRLDDAKTSSFHEENKDDSYRKRKRELDELYTYGKFDDIKSEYIKRLQGSDYRINVDDGPVSRDLLSRLDITRNKLTFKGVESLTLIQVVYTDFPPTKDIKNSYRNSLPNST
jgi:hypothetical protein